MPQDPPTSLRRAVDDAPVGSPCHWRSSSPPCAVVSCSDDSGRGVDRRRQVVDRGTDGRASDADRVQRPGQSPRRLRHRARRARAPSRPSGSSRPTTACRRSRPPRRDRHQRPDLLLPRRLRDGSSPARTRTSPIHHRDGASSSSTGPRSATCRRRRSASSPRPTSRVRTTRRTTAAGSCPATGCSPPTSATRRRDPAMASSSSGSRRSTAATCSTASSTWSSPRRSRSWSAPTTPSTWRRRGATCTATTARSRRRARRGGRLREDRRHRRAARRLGEEVDVHREAATTGLATPAGLAHAPDGGIYVSSVFNGVINEYDADGTFVRNILSPPAGESLARPHTRPGPRSASPPGPTGRCTTPTSTSWSSPESCPAPVRGPEAFAASDSSTVFPRPPRSWRAAWRSPTASGSCRRTTGTPPERSGRQATSGHQTEPEAHHRQPQPDRARTARTSRSR